MAQFSDRILDSNIAPGVSDFTSAEIPNGAELAAEVSYWMGHFFLNSTLRAQFQPPMNAYAYNFLRRAQRAFFAHDEARNATLGFLSSGRQSAQGYANALFHWETFLGQTWHALQILATAWDGKVFTRGDNSTEQRLNALYNQMKHVESRIDNNQMIAGATVPVWLSNTGLVSIDTVLTFAETEILLKELAKYANALVDPKTAREKLEALDGD